MKILLIGGSVSWVARCRSALSLAGHEVRILDKLASPWLRAEQTMLIESFLNFRNLATRWLDVRWSITLLRLRT